MVGFQFLFFSVHRAIGTGAWKIALHVDVLCIGKNANSYHCFALAVEDLTWYFGRRSMISSRELIHDLQMQLPRLFIRP